MTLLTEVRACSWNATGRYPCPNVATHLIGEYALCDDHNGEITARVAREYPIALPTCEPERSHEPIVDHGARVLAFILQTSCTATLSDRELQHADLAAHYAIIARGILPTAATALSDTRHLIHFMLRERQTEEQERVALRAAGGQLTGKLGTGGPGDREPRQPKPKTEPPVGVALEWPKVEIRF